MSKRERPRMACPECGKDVAHTAGEWDGTVYLRRHKRPGTKEWCTAWRVPAPRYGWPSGR